MRPCSIRLNAEHLFAQTRGQQRGTATAIFQHDIRARIMILQQAGLISGQGQNGFIGHLLRALLIGLLRKAYVQFPLYAS